MTRIPAGASPAKPSYSKPWLSISDQVALLQSRGLVVSDRAFAEQFLTHLNYYRFSGYCLAFETSRHNFAGGTTFESVVDAYYFDLTLRDLVTEALEVVEVDLRAAIAYHFGKRHGPFGHTVAANFFGQFHHSGWLTRLREESDRSSELFVEHFRNSYAEFPDLPVWIVMEVMSFGGLSQMVKGMLKADQKAIATRYGLQPRVLQKATHHLTYVRNLCAHHSRLWDRVWAIKPELPVGAGWSPPQLPGNGRLFCTLLLLRKMLKRIPAATAFSDEWRSRVEARMTSLPATFKPLNRLGLTPNWNTHPVWN
jgi:abortive infection bacteriophage resistance protein